MEVTYQYTVGGRWLEGCVNSKKHILHEATHQNVIGEEVYFTWTEYHDMGEEVALQDWHGLLTGTRSGYLARIFADSTHLCSVNKTFN